MRKLGADESDQDAAVLTEIAMEFIVADRDAETLVSTTITESAANAPRSGMTPHNAVSRVKAATRPFQFSKPFSNGSTSRGAFMRMIPG